DEWIAVGVLGGEIRRIEFGFAAQRRTFGFGSAEDLLLIADPVDVPRLQQHPDLADDLIGAPVHPGLVAVVDPDETAVLRVAGDVAGTVLESQQVSWGQLTGAGRGA